MMNLVNRFTYREEWSGEDRVYIARCLEFPSLAAHGDTPEAALAEIKKVVAAVLKDMSRNGEPIPEPLGARKYRGRIALRVPSDVHKRLVIEAAEQGVSVNQLLLSKI
jgi:predicted RNase H-like HicB family nuclease